MNVLDGQSRKPAETHRLGQDLSFLSVADIEVRIEALRAEISRLETELESKSHTKSAAEALFRRS